MAFANRLDPQRYLQNKEYFDSSLIELLEKQTEQISTLKAKAEVDKSLKQQYRKEASDAKYFLNDQKALRAEAEKKLAAVQDDNAALKTKNADLFAQLNKLYAEILELTKENKALKDELSFYKESAKQKKDSTNSNIPTSNVMFKANANSRQKTGKPRGGQPGHPVHKSKFQKPDKVKTLYVLKAPTGAVKCTDENGNTYPKIIQKVGL